MPKLTKSVVDAAEPRVKQFTIWCSELKGFGVFVLPSGCCTYFVDYRRATPDEDRPAWDDHGGAGTQVGDLHTGKDVERR